MKKVLTDRALKTLKPAPAGDRYEIWDAVVPGLGLRITDRGRRSFFVMRRRAGGELVRHTLGVYGIYPTRTLVEARTKAREALEDLARGKYPREREEERLREEARRHKDTVAAVAEEFIKRHVARLRSRKQCEAIVRRELIPRWGTRPVTDITRRDVIELLEAIVDRGTPYAARHALAAASKLFAWALSRDAYGLEHSPCDRISKRNVIGPLEPRQRVLTNDELRLVWRAAERLSYPFGPLTRLLLLSGQRLNEVAGMRWSEVDLDQALWVIPPERMKGDAAHEVPLPQPAVGLLMSLPRFDGDFVFTTTGGRRPVSGFSKAKRRLDRVIAEIRGKEPNEIPGWVFHDLRRTMRTHLSALPIPDLVRELVIAHRKPGLHKVYDQHAYLDEKRHALELWAGRLRSIVEPAPANVVPLRA